MKDEKKIADGFLPHSHSEMMRELKFKEPCFGVIYADGMVMTGNEKWVDIMLRKDSTCIKAILYQQAEEWLWKKHKITVEVANVSIHSEGYHTWEFETTLNDADGMSIDYLEEFDSPIPANQKGILKAIEYIHKNKK